MASNAFRHVRSGEPLVIPAATYNAMVDAASANLNRPINLSPAGNGFDSLFVHVVNDTGRNLQKFDVVGIENPLQTGDGGRIVFSGVVPRKEHKGKFAIVQQDASIGTVVRATLHGVTFARLKHDGNKEPKLCDIIEGDTSFLKSGGTCEVLWSESGKSNRWAIIRLGGGGGGIVFPVKLTQYGGSAGTHDKPTTWTYKIRDIATDEELTTEAVDPTESPHQWKRPDIGQLSKATFGYAHYEEDELVLGWINETLVLSKCE